MLATAAPSLATDLVTPGLPGEASVNNWAFIVTNLGTKTMTIDSIIWFDHTGATVATPPGASVGPEATFFTNIGPFGAPVLELLRCVIKFHGASKATLRAYICVMNGQTCVNPPGRTLR